MEYSTKSHLLLSLEEREIRTAFQTLHFKIEQLEKRLKNLDDSSLDTEVRQNTLQTFVNKLALFEGEINQVKEAESAALQKSADSKQAFNEKYKNLFSNMERILREKSKLDSISRISNAYVGTEDSPSAQTTEQISRSSSGEAFKKFPPSEHLYNSNSPSFDSSDDMMTLSPTIKKLLKSPRFEERLNNCEKSADEFSDISTPPLLSKLSLISSSSCVPIDEVPSVSTDEDTPRFSLSKRSYDFFKYLISPKASSAEKKTPVSQSEDLTSSNKAPSFSSKYTNSVFSDSQKLPTTPLANKACGIDDDFSSGLENESFTFYEANSLYADVGNESSEATNSPFHSKGYEFNFRSKYAN
jgi:hypothetical protein